MMKTEKMDIDDVYKNGSNSNGSFGGAISRNSGEHSKMALTVNHEVIEYYKMLKSMPDKATKLPKIEKDDEFIKALDKVDDLKIPFVASYVLLNIAYKTEISSNRAKTIKQNIHSNRVESDASNGKSKSDNDQSSSPNSKNDANAPSKLSKLDFIPSYFNSCTSPAIKIAVALFLKPSCAEPLKRDFVVSILNEKSPQHNVGNVIDVCRQQSIGEIRAYIKETQNLKTTDKQRKQLVCALVDASEILRDRSCAKLAICISNKGYLSLINTYVERGRFKHIIPFEPLINLYVKESIAKFTQDDERMKIHNQFSVNPMTTIKDVIAGLPPPPQSLNCVNTNKISKSWVACAEQTFQIYKGLPNYTKDLNSTYHIENGRRYRIITYNDCLYDVIGYSYDSKDGSTPIAEIFDKMSWSDRLNVIRFRTKILVDEIKGSEINDYHGNSADITISWFDDNDISCSKTLTFKKTDSKK